MNQRSAIALAVGLLSGLIAFYLLYSSASEIEKRSTPVQVLMATDYIPAGTYLNSSMVAPKEVPGAFVSPSAIRDLKEISGLIPLVPISAGEQILSNKFGVSEETLSLSLGPGERAFTLAVNETTGVGGLLRPGNRVDVLSRIEGDRKVVSSFVLQDIKIVAVGQNLNGRSQKTGSSGAESGPYSTVTLAVTPEQAETLFFLENHPLRLVLRGPNDDEIVAIQPQSDSEVLSKLGHFSSSSRRSPGIQVIHGNSN
ncbi:MAG TPA: Flp pilus assembly protein CpaB [bacterium]|nr:Flp pilus assembly protein CpaB [bacterium]